MSHELIITSIRALHRERCYAMTQRIRSELALLGYIRTTLGWSRALPKDEGDKIAEHAKAILKDKDTSPEATAFAPIIEASQRAAQPFEEIEAKALKGMRELAKQLPVWEEFGAKIKGFGEASLAVIVGEAGDIGTYANPAKLWKRMGLAVIDGVRQGGLRKNASAEDWVAHGYSRQRRSRMWNIGDALMKGNGDGEYRQLYLQRLAAEHAKAIAEGLIPATRMKATVESWQQRGLPPLTLVSKLTEEHRSAGHMAKRAQRYTEKRLLRSLWQAWRRSTVLAQPHQGMTETTQLDHPARAPHTQPVEPVFPHGQRSDATQTATAKRNSKRPAKKAAAPKIVSPDAHQLSAVELSSTQGQGTNEPPTRPALRKRQAKRPTQPKLAVPDAFLSEQLGPNGSDTHGRPAEPPMQVQRPTVSQSTGDLLSPRDQSNSVTQAGNATRNRSATAVSTPTEATPNKRDQRRTATQSAYVAPLSIPVRVHDKLDIQTVDAPHRKRPAKLAVKPIGYTPDDG